MIKKIVSVLIIIICLGSFLPEKVDASLYYLETTNYNRSATIYKGKQKKIRIGARIKGEKILKWWVSNSKLKIVKKKKTYCIVKAKKVGISYVKGKMLCGDGKIRKVKLKIRIKKKSYYYDNYDEYNYYSSYSANSGGSKSTGNSGNSGNNGSSGIIDVKKSIIDTLKKYGRSSIDRDGTYYYLSYVSNVGSSTISTTIRCYDNNTMNIIVYDRDGYKLYMDFNYPTSSSCYFYLLNTTSNRSINGYLYKNKINQINAVSISSYNINSVLLDSYSELATSYARKVPIHFDYIMTSYNSSVRSTDIGFH